MKSLGVSAAMALVLVTSGAARGQAPETSAKIETVPLTLTPPDSYQSLRSSSRSAAWP